MIVTGLFLWWPRGRGPAGVVWPRLGQGKRVFWRDLHAVTGFWVAGLALVLLVTGLPWATAWGSAFKSVREDMGWVKGAQDWTIGGEAAGADEHAEHDHGAMMHMSHAQPSMALLDRMVAHTEHEGLAFPALISPPEGMAGKGAAWTVKSDSQNRPLRTTLRYDATSGALLSRAPFAQTHLIDRVVGYGIAWHEGQLFGWVNQLIGVLTSCALILLATSGFIMWRRRKPEAQLGAPPRSRTDAQLKVVAGITVVLGCLMPLLGLSLIALLLVDRLVLPLLPPAQRWLGLAKVARAG
jgi:uncharacterized iron-regulated membrane protein